MELKGGDGWGDGGGGGLKQGELELEPAKSEGLYACREAHSRLSSLFGSASVQRLCAHERVCARLRARVCVHVCLWLPDRA